MLQIETWRVQESKSKSCFLQRIKILINNARYLKPLFLERRWINNQRKSNTVCYNTPHWKIIALICCARRSPKVTLITVFVSIVTWKQARWPPLFITFLISPCLVTSTYQVSTEIYGGIFCQGITLINNSNKHWKESIKTLKTGNSSVFLCIISE